MPGRGGFGRCGGGFGGGFGPRVRPRSVVVMRPRVAPVGAMVMGAAVGAAVASSSRNTYYYTSPPPQTYYYTSEPDYVVVEKQTTQEPPPQQLPNTGMYVTLPPSNGNQGNTATLTTTQTSQITIPQQDAVTNYSSATHNPAQTELKTPPSGTNMDPSAPPPYSEYEDPPPAYDVITTRVVPTADLISFD